MDEDLAALVKDDTREKMGKAIEHVRHEMGAVRTGRQDASATRKDLFYGKVDDSRPECSRETRVSARGL